MRKSTLVLIAFFALFLILPAKASAYVVQKGNSIIITKDQTVNDNLYLAGQNITVEGRVRGDVICAGQNINIKGPVEGSVFCAGQSINIDAPVSGSVNVAASTVNINGIIGQNVKAFGAAVNLGSAAKVGWDMLVGAASANIDGQVNKDLHGGGAAIVINGKVGKNANLNLDGKDTSLTVGDNAVIGGNLLYKSSKEASISSKAKITGKTERTEIKKGGGWQGQDMAQVWVWAALFAIFSSILIGLVLIGLFKKPVVTTADMMLEKIAASIGMGFSILILGPIALILLALTIIGIPLALLLFGVWIIAIGLSKIMAGIFVGRVLVKKYWPAKKDSLTWQMILGTIIFIIIVAIPFIGWLLGLIAACWALGAMFFAYKKA